MSFSEGVHWHHGDRSGGFGESNGGLLLPPETQELMGVHPLQAHVVGKAVNSLQDRVLGGLLDAVEKTGGSSHADLVGINSLFFPVRFREEAGGMFDYRPQFKEGVGGVALLTVPEVPTDEGMVEFVWGALGNAATQYGVIAVGDEQTGVLRRLFVVSMEGAHPEVDLSKGEAVGYLEAARRLSHLAGGEKASHWEYDWSMLRDQWYSYDAAASEVMKAGRSLRDMGLLPDIYLGHYVSWLRARAILTFLEVSGLSIGNMSLHADKHVLVTGSGVRKGELERDQVVALARFNTAFNGTVVEASKGVRKVKQSVEAFDQFAAYVAAGLIGEGYVREPDIQAVLPLMQNRELVRQVLPAGRSLISSMIHLHVDPSAWDEGLFNVVEVDPRLVPHGAYHSSCGTRPLALYSLEGLMRGIFADSGKITVLKLPNHGIQIASPYSLAETVEMIAPKEENISFRGVSQK
ncbi:MAG: hypothetical protein HY381_00450 [Candidatus Chisholmbacteria bacterium]|nr:hypothetical protein [Candidatus Chisholmbacteria bacterium]